MLDDILKRSRLKKKDYSGLYLKSNPFPSLTVPEASPPFTADREKEAKHLEEVLTNLIHEHSSSVTVFVGEYGSGKSHLLRAFKYYINRELFSFGEDGVLAIYLQSPGRSMLDLYLEFVEDLSREQLTNFALRIISQYVQQSGDSLKNLVYDKDVKHKMSSAEKDIPLLLKSSQYINLFRELVDNRFSALENQDVIFSLLNLAHPEVSGLAWKWFLGSNLNKSEMQLIHVRDGIDTPSGGYSALKDLIRIINLAGIPNIVLLIDEFETMSLLPRNQRANFQDEIRHLIDEYPKNMVTFFAIAAYQWEELREEVTGLTRRLRDYNFQLEFFSELQVRELIEAYLKHARGENFPENTKTIKGCPAALYPFNEEAIKEIYTETEGVSSRVLSYSRKAIEYMIDTGGTVVTEKTIKTIADKEV